MKEKFEDPVGKEFEFPQALINQISECAPDGYIIFYIDSRGRPQVRATFQHQIVEMGLRSYATKFLRGVNMAEELGIADAIHEDNADEEEDSD